LASYRRSRHLNGLHVTLPGGIGSGELLPVATPIPFTRPGYIGRGTRQCWTLPARGSRGAPGNALVCDTAGRSSEEDALLSKPARCGGS
jgi:hypothetical protein